jgi:hypothetical protein
MCVDTDGLRTFLSQCDASRTTQWWWLTPAGEVRNGRYPTECLDVSEESFRNGTNVIVYPCHGRRNQTWQKNGQSLRSGGYCLAVPEAKYTSGTRLIIWTCGSGGQTFDVDALGVMTNRRAANLGFRQHAECAARAAKDQCYLAVKNPGFDPAAWRYGFHSGAGHGGGRYTLDFGETYSVDRCSHAHDSHYWSCDTCENDVGYKKCLDQVRPSTPEEKVALDDAHGWTSGWISRCLLTIPPPGAGTLPANTNIDGRKDAGWKPRSCK